MHTKPPPPPLPYSKTSRKASRGFSRKIPGNFSICLLLQASYIQSVCLPIRSALSLFCCFPPLSNRSNVPKAWSFFYSLFPHKRAKLLKKSTPPKAFLYFRHPLKTYFGGSRLHFVGVRLFYFLSVYNQPCIFMPAVYLYHFLLLFTFKY